MLKLNSPIRFNASELWRWHSPTRAWAKLADWSMTDWNTIEKLKLDIIRCQITRHKRAIKNPITWCILKCAPTSTLNAFIEIAILSEAVVVIVVAAVVVVVAVVVVINVSSVIVVVVIIISCKSDEQKILWLLTRGEKLWLAEIFCFPFKGRRRQLYFVAICRKIYFQEWELPKHRR